MYEFAFVPKRNPVKNMDITEETISMTMVGTQELYDKSDLENGVMSTATDYSKLFCKGKGSIRPVFLWKELAPIASRVEEDMAYVYYPCDDVTNDFVKLRKETSFSITIDNRWHLEGESLVKDDKKFFGGNIEGFQYQNQLYVRAFNRVFRIGEICFHRFEYHNITYAVADSFMFGGIEKQDLPFFKNRFLDDLYRLNILKKKINNETLILMYASSSHPKR